MIAVLERITWHTPHIATFWFCPTKPLRFTAGEYTQLYIPHKNTDDRGDKRWFSIASSPTEKLFTIICKFAQPSSSFKYALRSLPIGTAVHFAEPMGDFVLPKDSTRPLLFVAGGMGIAPIYSMATYLEATKQRRNTRLLYGAQNEEELVLLDVFQRCNIPYTPIVSKPSKKWTGEIGHLTTQRILQATFDSDNSLIYIAGPESFVEKLNNELQVQGVPAHRILTDFFLGYPRI